MAIEKATERKLNNLRIWNIIVGLILAAQAVVMALLTNKFSLPVTATFMRVPQALPLRSTICLIFRPAGAYLPLWLFRPWLS